MRKKIMTLALATVMGITTVLSSLPVSVKADDSTTTQNTEVSTTTDTQKDNTEYVICYPKTKVFNNEQQIAFSEDAKFTSLKSSKKSVATVRCRKNSWGYAVYANVKKVGTTTVSYKLKGVTYTKKVIAKKYVNPYKKVTVNGQNITSQFKKSNVAVVSYKKYKNKKVTVKYVMKKDWAQVHTDYCKNEKIIKCLGTFKYKMSVKKPKKNSDIEASVFDRKNDVSDQYSVIVFK